MVIKGNTRSLDNGSSKILASIATPSLAPGASTMRTCIYEAQGLGSRVKGLGLRGFRFRDLGSRV